MFTHHFHYSSLSGLLYEHLGLEHGFQQLESIFDLNFSFKNEIWEKFTARGPPCCFLTGETADFGSFIKVLSFPGLRAKKVHLLGLPWGATRELIFFTNILFLLTQWKLQKRKGLLVVYSRSPLGSVRFKVSQWSVLLVKKQKQIRTASLVKSRL